MADDTFRPRKPEEANQTPNDPVDMAQQMRQQANPEAASENPIQGAFNIQGNVPPAFQAALSAARGDAPKEPKRGFGQMSTGGDGPVVSKPQNSSLSATSHLQELLQGLRDNKATYEELELPSKGKFYNGEDGPSNGIISIRAMTGEEEQILATPRFVRKGQAINMIFQKCIKESFRPENLLTIDRTYLLIYLRGISYSPEYEVEIKCPECEKKFSTTIDLNSLYVESCPGEYGPNLQDVLPNSKLPFTYRLSTGKDEQDIQEHRDRRLKAFGDASADDTLIYRTAQLLLDIDGITDKQELQVLLKNLPINDVAYIRSLVNEPPFGVDTSIEMVCGSCLQEFDIDLPLEANFFFPRRKKVKTQV